MVKVEIFRSRFLNENCYIVSDHDEERYFVVDPGYVTEDLRERVKNISSNVEYILLTHGHFDHIGAVKKLQKFTGAKVAICDQEKNFISNNELNLGKRVESFEVDIYVQDGDKLPFGKQIIDVIHTPGHTIGSVCYMFDGNLFSGDTIFKGCTGRCDLPTGSSDMMQESLQKLFQLSDRCKVYPGHDDITTLSEEKVEGCLKNITRGDLI